MVVAEQDRLTPRTLEAAPARYRRQGDPDAVEQLSDLALGVTVPLPGAEA